MKYIPPGKGKLYRFIASLRSPYRYGITLFVGIVLGYVWLVGLYRPLDAMVQLRRVSVDELRKKQILYTQSRVEDDKLCDNVHCLQRTLMAYTNGVEGASYDSGMIPLLQAAENSGLHFVSSVCDNEQDKAWACGERLRFTFEGTLSQAQQFFQNIKTARMLVGCCTLDVIYTHDTVFTISCLLDVYTLKKSCFT